MSRFVSCIMLKYLMIMLPCSLFQSLLKMCFSKNGSAMSSPCEGAYMHIIFMVRFVRCSLISVAVPGAVVRCVLMWSPNLFCIRVTTLSLELLLGALLM